jgi:hypothetical protein
MGIMLVSELDDVAENTRPVVTVLAGKPSMTV